MEVYCFFFTCGINNPLLLEDSCGCAHFTIISRKYDKERLSLPAPNRYHYADSGGGITMSKFYRFRQLCRYIGILACITALVGIVLSASAHTVLGCSLVGIGIISLLVDITLIAAKNRCPFCNKSLRIAPSKGEEFCPHCGCKID